MTTSTRGEIRVGPIAIRFLLEGEESGGSVAIFEFDVPAGARLPAAHSHDGYEETVYGLRGTVTWTLDGQSTDIGPGEVLCIPRGIVHRFDNNGDDDATVLAVVTPGMLGPGYFRDLEALISASTGGPPDPAAVGEIMLRHGLTPAP